MVKIVTTIFYSEIGGGWLESIHMGSPPTSHRRILICKAFRIVNKERRDTLLNKQGRDQIYITGAGTNI